MQPTRGVEVKPHRRAAVPLLGLAPGGVYRAPNVTIRAVRSYRTFSPLPAAGRRCVFCGTSQGLPLPAVSRHPALWSSDFPLRSESEATTWPTGQKYSSLDQIPVKRLTRCCTSLLNPRNLDRGPRIVSHMRSPPPPLEAIGRSLRRRLECLTSIRIGVSS